MVSFREKIEEKLLKFPEIRSLNEKLAKYIEDFKDGTFGLSYLGLLLYCNGRNPRGLSQKNPNGLVYFDKENIFGVGVFRRELEQETGNLMIVAPRGLNGSTIPAVEIFARKALEIAPELKGSMLYVRFLKNEQLKDFLKRGFQPVHEAPWHPEAFAEDETFNHAIVRLDDIIDFSAKGRKIIRKFRGSKRNRQAFCRFENFLKRAGFEWKTEMFDSINGAKNIVADHFSMLAKLNKQIGSVPEDYWNLLEASKKSRFGIIMKACKNAKQFPVSVFVGEKISKNRLALYCTISRRDYAIYKKEFSLSDNDFVGFNGLSVYCFLQAFMEAKKQFPEIEEVHLGGSETADLNAFKRRLGARNAPTYWVCKKL